jgi:PAS domain-containing protein
MPGIATHGDALWRWLAVAQVLVALPLAVLVVGQWRSMRRAQRTAQRIEAGLNGLPVGVALWDAEDRLVACNEAYRALFPEIAGALVPGADYVSLTRRYYAVAPADVVAGRTEEQFVADGIARHRGAQSGSALRPHRGGWLLMEDRPTAGGGVVSFRMDVTDREQAYARLRRSEERLRGYAEFLAAYRLAAEGDGKGLTKDFKGYFEYLKQVFKAKRTQVFEHRRGDYRMIGIPFEASHKAVKGGVKHE